jgi:hypothetical protein
MSMGLLIYKRYGMLGEWALVLVLGKSGEKISRLYRWWRDLDKMFIKGLFLNLFSLTGWTSFREVTNVTTYDCCEKIWWYLCWID